MSARTHWGGWVLAAMAATSLVYGMDVLFHPVPAAGSELLQKFGSSWVFFGAAALCVVRGRASREERWAWWLFALAMALWGTGAVYFAVVLWDRVEVPYPSMADGFWLAFYLPAYAGLCKLLRARSGSAGSVVWLDALVGGLGVGAAGAAVVFQAIFTRTEGPAIAVATNLAYPLGDLGILALVVGAVTVTGWRSASVWRWIAAAFALFAAADSLYLVQVAEGKYEIGGFLDLGWPAAALLVGVAAWRAEPRLQTTGQRGMPIFGRALWGFAALTLLALGAFIESNPLTIGLAAATISVMLVRLYLAVRDNERLLAHSRRDAETDPLTGLGNRRRLAADLAVLFEEVEFERPRMLTLFDLDGFKQYNDTFGHLAGDQLLERLATRLCEVMAAHGGTAYRMGGDEFCALWTFPSGAWSLPGGEEASALTGEAQAALSEQGQAFSIGCSYGSALLPNEASSASDALRLADRRMYIGKRGRRTSAGQQSSDVLLRTLTERDAKLGVHLDGVAELVCATMVRLGVPEEDMEPARQTALLHDVGKVAIPDEILNKPGALNEAETAFIRRHTLIGERIISAAPALETVARLVRSTHERYDGNGYPDRLAGDLIPLISRVVAVCDAYDAMTNDRVYRAARANRRAIGELRVCSGTQFDPVVVEAFVDVLQASGEDALTDARPPFIARPSHSLENGASAETAQLSAAPGNDTAA